MSEVYVVTNPELGWDCVLGVFKADDVSEERLKKVFPGCIIHFHVTHKDTLDFEEFEDE